MSHIELLSDASASSEGTGLFSTETFRQVNTILEKTGKFDVELARLDYNQDIKVIVNILKNRLKSQDITGNTRRIIMVTIRLTLFTHFFNQPVSITTPMVTNEKLKQMTPNMDPNDKKVIVLLRTTYASSLSNRVKISSTRFLNVPGTTRTCLSSEIDFKLLDDETRRIYITRDNIGISTIGEPILKLFSPFSQCGDAVEL